MGNTSNFRCPGEKITEAKGSFASWSTPEKTPSTLHVDVWVGNEAICRIELNGGIYMDQPPPGNFRDILQAYARHAAEIRETWDAIHRR